MKISVILTTYNRPEYFAEALASYKAQDYLDSELIIVNDGGDPPGPIDGDPRIKYHRKPHGGQARAINFGAEKATGDLRVWLCDDDLFSDHEALSKRAALFARSANTEFIATAWKIIDAAGNETGEIYTPGSINAVDSFRREKINLSAAMWKKSLHDRLGGFNVVLDYYLDWDWKIRVSMEAECLTSDIVTAKYRVHSGQAGVRRRAEKADACENKKMRDGLRARYEDLV